jgi:hypothetical protein
MFRFAAEPEGLSRCTEEAPDATRRRVLRLRIQKAAVDKVKSLE